MEIRRSTLERMREEDMMIISEEVDQDIIDELDADVEDNKMSLAEVMFTLGTKQS